MDTNNQDKDQTNANSLVFKGRSHFRLKSLITWLRAHRDRERKHCERVKATYTAYFDILTFLTLTREVFVNILIGSPLLSSRRFSLAHLHCSLRTLRGSYVRGLTFTGSYFYGFLRSGGFTFIVLTFGGS